MKKAIVFVTLLVCVAGFVSAQATAGREPVFPSSIPGLIYLEGEDAASTNFAAEANLDYASSGQRILQLNQGPQAPGAPFFAEYAFYAETAGDYELWLGGTPPGAQDALIASYASPIRLQIDGGPAQSIYREQVSVVENYTVTNYWSMVRKPINLSQGSHVLRLEVAEKRRYDSHYYFNLDALFFLKAGSPAQMGDGLPPSFPKKRSDRSIDNPYLSIAQYEARIQNSPKELGGYLELAGIYSLVGDYNNALKILNRAQVNLGENPRVTLLMAKNRIWSGEFEEGLRLYRIYLKSDPSNLPIWAESAKVLAWLGQYAASLELYREARKVFPDDLNLLVNQGLTLLWANQVKEGEGLLGQAWNIAKTDVQSIKSLANIFWVNGYPDKTVQSYRQGATAWPDSLEMLLLLEDSLLRIGQIDQAAEVKTTIIKTFRGSDRLNAYLDNFELKSTLKQKLLDSYGQKLLAHPDDLKLREELAKAYFWNGRKDEAILETRNILVNRLYRQLQLLDGDLKPTYQLLDTSYLNLSGLRFIAANAQKHSKDLQASFDAWKQAYAKTLELSKATADKEKLPAAQEALDLASAQLALQLNNAKQLINYQEALSQGLASLDGDTIRETAALDADAKILASRKPWSWDRDFALQELNQAAGRKQILADFALARINLIENSPGAAQASLSRLSTQDQAPAEFRRLVSQASIWTDRVQDPAFLTTGDYYGYGKELAKIPALNIPAVDTAPFSDQTPIQAQSVLKDLAGLSQKVQARQTELARWQLILHRRAQARLQIHYYQFEADSFALRFQLGDYYLNQNKNAEARQQLEKVLLIEPGNINARYSLGRARQLSGDWSGAMKLYQDVYRSDPKFENTASLYNQLAKIHADRITGAINSFWDSNRVTTRSQLEYKWGGDSQIGFSAGYALDTLRLIKPVTLNRANAPQNDPVTINLNTVNFTLPLTFADIGLSAYVKAGGTFQDLLFTNSFRQSDTVGFDALYNSQVIAPLAGVGVNWNSGPLGLYLSYTFDRLPDSFFPYRVLSNEHLIEATANLYFGFAAPSVLRSLGSRTYGKLALVNQPSGSEANTMYAGVEELVFTFQVSEAPWTIFNAIGTVSWEDSTLGAAETNYYSPGQVLVAKLGLQLATWLGLGDSWVLGINGRLAGGLNDTAGLALFAGEGELRFELGRGDWTAFVDLGASFTLQNGNFNYWTINAQVGVNIGLPNYLVP